MKLKPYAEYKDSGVESLGIVPSSWIVQPLKFSTNIYSGNSLNDTEKNMYESEDIDGFPYISSKDINLENHEIDYENGLRIPKWQCQLKIAYKGSFLLCIEGGSAGKKVALLNQDVCFVNKLCCFTSKENNKFKYYFTQTQNFKDKFQLSMTGLIGGVSTSLLKNISIPWPSPQEQSLIANFLDRETAKLDTLIAKQERLIELLQEKRQAIISHAVTKGLNPDAKMKDSGVDWIGDTPDHWEILNGKRIFKILKRIAGELGYDILSITQKGIKIKDITSGDGQLSMDYSKYQIVEEGDFAMNHMDLLTGYVDISPHKGVTSPDYRVFKSINDSKNSPDYYLYILQNCYVEKLFFPYGQGSAQLGRWRLPTDAFNYFKYPSPPFEEQVIIAEHIKINSTKIDSLIHKAKLSIDLAKEHRTALISAAVTGKIDVRELA